MSQKDEFHNLDNPHDGLFRDLAAGVEQLANAEEELGALGQRGRAPGRVGVLRSPDGGVHLFGASEVDGSALAARRRVVDGATASGSAVHPAAADPVRDPGGARRVDGLRHVG